MNKPSHMAARHCSEIPDFERLNYFYGQMLGASDFRSEQAYFREKLKLHNRCLHGYGVVCGLEVTAPVEESRCPPGDGVDVERIKADLGKIDEEIAALQAKLASKDIKPAERDALQKQLEEAAARRKQAIATLNGQQPANPDGSAKCGDDDRSIPVIVQCGLALDCEGNEIVLRQPVMVDLWKALKASEQATLREAGKGMIYLGICHCGEPINPTRPVVPDSCGAISDCNFGKIRESVRFTVTLEKPETDERCDTCCAGCGCDCQLLAAVQWEVTGPIDQSAINNSVRRPIGLYQPTVITGISWEHGRSYSPIEAKAVLGTEGDMGRTNGIEIAFSRPVHAASITPGVVEIWRIQGGRGLRGMISCVEGAYVGKPDSGMISSVRYRDESGETLNSGDRLLIIVRGDFILDHCCRPLDGNHIGGRVPQLSAYRKPEAVPAAPAPSAEASQVDEKGREIKRPYPEPKGGFTPDGAACRLPPGGIGPWTSGNGSVGGTFESWINID